MATDIKHLAILGFPESGKTTYLASLYAASQSGESSTIRIVHPPEDSTYLDAAVENLEALKKMPHTTVGEYTGIELDIKVIGKEESYKLIVPDVSGEEFDGQWEHRSASSDVLDLYAKADALLLFIFCKIDPAPTIQEVHDIVGTMPPVDDADVDTEYLVSKAPIDIKVVEILQQALRMRAEKSGLRVAVIASGWDIELKNGKEARSPEQWLEMDLSIVWQYLRANSDRLVYEVFGVSAQGGDYAVDTRKLEKLSPSRRAKVVHAGKADNDIFGPLRWALEF